MRSRSNISPVSLSLPTTEEGVALRYLDGRMVEYVGPIRERDGTVDANMAYHVHVLVTAPDQTEGRMVYVNDYDTTDEVLESTGVGRIILGEGDEASVYPGVMVRRSEERITVEADADAIDGAVYTFVENQLDERAYRLV